MKQLKNLVSTLMLLALPLLLTGCEELFGEWDKPTPQTSEPAPTPVAFNPLTTPLTLEATVANTTVTFALDAGITAPTYEVFSADGSSIDSGTYSGPLTLVNVGDKVSFKADNATYVNGDHSEISCSEPCYVYGNIMSLVKSSGFESEIVLSSDATFACLFMNNSKIMNHGEKALALPATTLTAGCYMRMFEGCTGLNYVKCLATGKAAGATGCTKNWLYGVATSGTFIRATTSVNWVKGVNGIPEGWAPDPAFPVFNAKATPLTFEAQSANTNVTFKNKAANPVYYSTDGGQTWPEENKIANNETKSVTLYDIGDRVMFKATNTVYYINEYNLSNFSCYDYCYIYGNIMSLIDKDNYETETNLPTGNDHTFCALFDNNSHIKNLSDKSLVLPATGLTEFCYASLFRGCANLTVAPELPASTLKKKCYYKMFSGCTQLTTAPELKATTLVEQCYWEMFNGCTNLNYVKCLATGDDGNSGFKGDFLNGVAASGTIVTSSTNANWQNTDTSQKWYYPSGWTKTTE